ncbi:MULTISPECIES: hypothetical protein [unclassified Mesorhizobium]|nr:MULTISPECIES: hypothetical protein [unclassified Mesorhizobium]TGS69287.1 hypothetical protein EN844_10535 [Mesorhizobium sp. M3A.F.Ca.ET.201.01.1.1]TGT60585.1 hypothetical protein EN813_023130 [Mesorhizobium sp. M00.F.Ca.ET.170.01.1.1]AZO10314.1 hypothetical protein EJ074_15185 [Mesorhizobium sp. M3A.F.Ca.ET.080.04.2.1]RWB73690.1 MAG: hypothetical protein EOQ49_09155 [Mesorhizobium sp.]RWB91754.1 MAG: hypothetical protein EOQ52_05250 [Mesorhizobium sp.]
MSAVQDRTVASLSNVTGRVRHLWVMVSCLLVLAIAVPWQTRWGTIPDTSWIITMCERVLAGDRLYVDLIETNPPFTIWLYLPAVYLANILGVAPEYVVHGYSYAICIFGLGFAGFVAHRAQFPGNSELSAFLPMFLALLVVFPGNSFSERENLGIAMFLPLLVLDAWRASEDRRSEPDWWLAAAAGLSGSIMVLVKPYYALMVVAPALYVAWRRGSIRHLFAIEYWVAGIACLTYLTAVFCLYPEFIRDLYPKLADTYLRYKWYVPTILTYGGAYLVSLCFLMRLQTGRALPPLVMVPAVASAAALVPLIYQGKGWPYHAYPAVVLLLGSILCSVATRPPGMTRMSLAQKILLGAVIASNWLPFATTQKPGSDFVATIRAAVDHPTVGLIGSGVQIGHPLTRMLDGRWISAYCSDWFGSFASAFAQSERARGDAVDAARHEALERSYLNAKIKNFETKKPDLILIQKADTFWIAQVMKRGDFANFMKDYQLLTEDQSVGVYIRSGSRKLGASG